MIFQQVPVICNEKMNLRDLIESHSDDYSQIKFFPVMILKLKGQKEKVLFGKQLQELLENSIIHISILHVGKSKA